MQNAVDHAVNRVMNTIPRQILEDAFGQPSVQRYRKNHEFISQIPVSVEARIISEVIDARVRPDSDLNGSKMIDVLMSQVTVKQFANYTWVIYIPDEATGGCTVTQFMGIYIMAQDYLSNTNFPWLGQNTMSHGAQGLVSTYGSIPAIASENGHLIARNTLEINDMNVVRTGGMLRLKVESDPAMSHLKPGSWQAFSELVLWATKSYIYRTLVLSMGMAQLQTGYQLGVYKDTVDGYQDAEESYQDYLKSTWRRVSQLNDPKRRRHAHRLLISRR